MTTNLKSILGKYCLALLVLLPPFAPVYGESNVIEEIVVTAQKRSESAQTVPVSVSAFTESMVEDTGVDTIAAIMPMIPGFTGTVEGVSLNIYAVRGVASNDFTVGSEPSVGTYVDDAYIGRNVLSSASFFDINRVEVVKGPQGTLFGRNSDSGAISIITNKPEQANTLDGGLVGGPDGQEEANLVGNLMVSDKLAFRLAYHRKRLDSSNLFRIVNQNENAFSKRDDFRLEALWQPSDEFSALITLGYSDAKTNLGAASFIPALQLPQPGKEFPHKIAFSIAPGHKKSEQENSRPWGADIRLTWDLNDTMTLTSITDARGYDFDFRQDVDGTSDDAAIDAIFAVGTGGSTLEFNQPNVGQKSWAQELRLVGASGNVDWFAGLSYFYEDVREFTDVNLIDTALGLGLLAGDAKIGNGVTNSVGVYGNATWHATEKLDLTYGIRWSLDSKNWSAFGRAGLGITSDTLGAKLHDQKTVREVTSRVVVNYQFTPQIMVYASVNQGFKGGGFNSNPSDFNGDGIADKVASFGPETSTAYEAGLKSELLQRRLRLNLSTFFNQFSDLQVETATLSGIRVTNEAKARAKGVEVELNYLTPIDGLVLVGNYSWLDAEFSSGSRKGNALIFAPTVTWSASLKYGVPLFGGSLNLWTVYTWQDDQFDDIDNTLRESGYGLWNAKLSFQPASERWEVFVRADNINNQNYAAGRQDIGLGLQLLQGFPRLIKAGFNFHIG